MEIDGFAACVGCGFLFWGKADYARVQGYLRPEAEDILLM